MFDTCSCNEWFQNSNLMQKWMDWYVWAAINFWAWLNQVNLNGIDHVVVESNCDNVAMWVSQGIKVLQPSYCEEVFRVVG